MSEKKKLLWVGDAACPSGFALVTHRVLDVLCTTFDVTVLGINYRGDPHTYPYPIYAAAPGGELLGVGRLIWMCDVCKPDVIVLQNDGWNIPHYMRQLARFAEYARIPVIVIVAVDGKNFQGPWLDRVSLAIFWTHFALDEARKGGYTGPAEVIPLGVDLDIYYPLDTLDARGRRLPRELDFAFIVGNVNRNQPRKRLDLTIQYFAEWVHRENVADAYLYLHVAPTGDIGIDVKQLSEYYGVLDRLILMQPSAWYGIPEHEMRDTYNCFDLQITTTQGEGNGFSTFEGMACGIPQIVPAWSALGELTRDVAWQVSCRSTVVGPPYVNVLGGVPDREGFVQALHTFYTDSARRMVYRQRGLDYVSQPHFRWSFIAQQFDRVIQERLDGIRDESERDDRETESVHSEVS